MIGVTCFDTLDIDMKQNSTLSITWHHLDLIEFQTFDMFPTQYHIFYDTILIPTTIELLKGYMLGVYKGSISLYCNSIQNSYHIFVMHCQALPH